jgi:DNA-directed RNA polymerase specialized sigma24 family protein
MATAPTFLDSLRQLTIAHLAADLSDRQLLERYAGRRDEAAFAALVRRHGPLVLGVCRRLLRDGHAAEDAFQATFLVLAQRAGSVARPEALGPWLHGVATRVALKPRAQAGLEGEAVGRLPEKLRVPFVLHYLEGQTVTAVARQLGCPRGTVATHLARARQRLRARLARRGVTLSTAGLGAVLSRAVAAGAAPPGMLGPLVKAAALTPAGTVPAAVVALAQGGTTIMSLRQSLVLTLALLLAVGAVGGGTILLAQGQPAPEQAGPQEAAPAADTDLSLFREGARRFLAEDYPGADCFFSRLLEKHPDGPLAAQARYLAMIARNNSRGGPEADRASSRLLEARRTIDAVLAGASAAEAGQGPAGQRRDRNTPAGRAAPQTLKGSDKEEEIEQVLRRRTNLEYKDAPLGQVLDDLFAGQALNHSIDRAALEEAGTSLQCPVSVHLRNVSLKTALNIVLHNAHLAYMVCDGVLVISTPAVCAGKLIRKVYPVNKLLGRDNTGEELLRLLKNTIEPKSWAEMGGTGTVDYFPLTRALVVNQTADLHEQVEEFLAALHRLAEGQAEK